jgi:hypothetical protein
MNVRPKDMDAFLDQYSRLRDALYYLWRYGEDLDAAAQARDFDAWVEYLSVLGATAEREAPLEDEVRPINKALVLQEEARNRMARG